MQVPLTKEVRTKEGKDENDIPVGINAGVIKHVEQHLHTSRLVKV